MTTFLLGRGADPKAIDENGDTPLLLAIRRQLGGHKYKGPWINGEYAVETLSNFITEYEEDGREIWEIIDYEREETVRQLLKKQDIDINIANNDGQYLLHMIFAETHPMYVMNKQIQ
ncbi:ankyrin [Penicillium malachiteum]|nr:ankyrin [Penicillium malachiteum]